MELKELLRQIATRVGEIDKRALEIKEIKTDDPQKLDELKREASDLLNEKRELEIKKEEALKQDQEERSRVLKDGAKIEKGAKEKMFEFKSTREALAFALGKNARKKLINEEEKRALDTSLGTTALTYVAASAEADGVSNFGYTINTKVVFDLLRAEAKLTPILNDINLSNVKGLTSFPYRVSRTKAQPKIEGKKVNDAQWEFANLEAKKGFVQTLLPVTEEVLQLSDIDLGAWILDTMFNDFAEDWSAELIYGNGQAGTSSQPARVSGITNGATSATFTAATLADDLLAAAGKLSARYARGAKVYVAHNVYNKIRTLKDGSGRYLFNPFSKETSVPGILGMDLVEDPTLNDGGILIGNVAENFKGNVLSGITLERDKDIHVQVTSFSASAFVAAAPVPSAFVYGTVTL